MGCHLMHEYDETQQREQYLLRNGRRFMTPLERRAQDLGILREKARDPSRSPALRARLMAEYEANVDPEVCQLTGDCLEDLLAFQQRVAERISSEFGSGNLTFNRCPACNCITKTPLARQCLWCGHDWHGS